MNKDITIKEHDTFAIKDYVAWYDRYKPIDLGIPKMPHDDTADSIMHLHTSDIFDEYAYLMITGKPVTENLKEGIDYEIIKNDENSNSNGL